MKNCTDLNLGEAFAYLLSFISQILDFIYYTLLIFIFNSVTVKTCNNVTFFLHVNVIAIFFNHLAKFG